MISRQLEMIYILMNRENVTAEELAGHFEVSTRTIYRDVESLSMAGIPIYAGRGKGGGIRLMERFVLDKMLLSEEEQRSILAALTSLRETGAVGEEKTLEKLETFFRKESLNWVAIDFSDWSGRRGELFGQIKEAILGRHVMEFDYYGQYGDMSRRQAEPVQLLFKEYTWYVRAWCRARRAMRLFKVLRMKRVEVLAERFEPGARHRGEEGVSQAPAEPQTAICGRETASAESLTASPETVPAESRAAVLNQENVAVESEMTAAVLEAISREPESVKAVSLKTDKAQEAGSRMSMQEKQKSDGSVITEVVFRLDRKEAYRVYDRFEENEITVLPGGDFIIRLCCPIDDWVYGLILSFGPSARVMSPEWVRQELAERTWQMARIYNE